MQLHLTIIKWSVLLLLYEAPTGIISTSVEGPRFKVEPPYNVVFSNNSGSKVFCSAVGQPTPAVDWISSDGSRVGNVPGLRQVGPEGVLYFPPFSAEDYRQDVHSVSYKCIANNIAGTIVSRNVNIRAVMSQQYEAHVYDAFPLEGNTAVLKCHLPQFIGSHVIITAWIKDNVIKIDSSVAKDNKYTIYGDELFVSDVGDKDSSSSFRCQTTNILTNEIKLSSTAGKLFVSEPKGNVSPRIVDGTISVSAVGDADITLPCIAQGFPVPELEWFIKSSNGQLIPIAFGNQFSRTKNSMIIQQIQISDAGIYVCVAKNSVGTETKEINVTVANPLTVRIEPNQVKLEVNKMNSLKCITKGNPITAQTWLKNGQPFHFNNLSDTIRIKESGMYQCFVRNEDYMVHDVAQVIAGDKFPEIVSAFGEKILESGNHLKLECLIKGNPQPNTNWFLDNKAIEESNRISIKHRNEKLEKVISILEISNLKTEDGGVYSCRSENIKGTAKHSSRINVIGKQRSQSIPFEPRQFLHENGSLDITNLVRGTDDGRYTCKVSNGKKEVKEEVEMVVMMPPKITPFSFQETLIREGMRARLQCVVSEGDTPIKLEWLKDNEKIPTNLGINIRHLDEFSSILTIANINPKHNGNYTCRATNAAAIETHTTVLNVNVPPKIVPFTFQDEHMLQGMLVRVSCVVSRGDLPLTISWLKDGQPIPKDLSITVSDFDEYSSILCIENVTSKHNGNYTCVASNSAAKITYSTPLVVKVPPKWIQTPNDTTAVVIGDEVKLDCTTEGFPMPIVTWTKSEAITKKREMVTTNRYQTVHKNGTLQIFSIKEEDKGFYFCQAKNGIGQLGAMIEVTIKTPPKMLQKSQTLTPHKNEDIVLYCEAYGDRPMNFTWKKDEFDLELKKSHFIINDVIGNNVSKSELKIRQITHKQSATYKCTANNAYGSDEAIFHLSVKDVPKAPSSLKLIESGNRTIIVSWTIQDNELTSIKKHLIQYKRTTVNWNDAAFNYTTPGKMNKAKLTKLIPSQKYHIRVLSENEVGFSEPSNQIEVTVADEAPDATPNDITVTAIDTNTLKISWKPPIKDHWNGIIRGYYVGYKIVGSSDPYTFKLIEVPDDYMNTLSLSINNLVKFTHYSVVVQAFNDGGKGPMSKEVVAVTSESVPSKAPTDIRCSVLGSQSLHLTWQPAPSSSIHGVLQGYKVFFKPTYHETSSNNGKMQPTFKTTATTKITLYKLLKYTNYSIQVLAYTQKGDGVKSDPIHCRTLEDVPGAVTDIKVLPASATSILVAWVPPEHSNGAITKYTIYVKDDADVVDQREVNGNQHYQEITGLKHGENYEFCVTASTTVGQGPKSRSISQSPGMKKIPARVAVFNTAVVTTEDKDVKLPCPAIGIPEPTKKWTKNGNPVELSKRIIALSDGSLLIKDIQRHESDNYTCHVENERGDDLVTYSVIVQTVPDAVTLDIALTTTTSIDILWKATSDGSASITEFKLFYKHEHMAWSTIDLEPHVESYRLDSLRCGTQYQLYMVAVNNIGEGKATSVITTSTKGGVPIVPEKQQLIDEGSSFITLNLNSWQTDSCVIKYFVVEYKRKLDSQWNLFSDDIQSDNRKILLSDLKPATWYDLRMIAHSNAGAAVAEYTFSTLTESGATISPDTVIDALPKSPLAVLMDLKFIIIFVTVIFVSLAVVLTLLCYCTKNKKKKHRHHRSHSHGHSKHSKNSLARYLRRRGHHHRRERPTTYAAGSETTQSDGRTIDSDELTPYATARLSDFQEHRRSFPESSKGHRSGHMSRSNELPNFPTQIPTAPPMSDSYSCNSLPFYSQIHKKGNQPPMTPSRNILKNVPLSAPPVPLTQPPELITQRLVKSGDFATTNHNSDAPLPENAKTKTENQEKYDSPWDLKGVPNN